jgi:uncharacterized membrane protein YbaN (DUF454 family)
MKVIALQVTGYAFLVLGVLGLFLPFLQGFLFIFIGLLILARHAAWAHNLLQRFRDSHPRAAELIDRAETTMADWWQRTETTVAGWWQRVVRCVRRSG